MHEPAVTMESQRRSDPIAVFINRVVRQVEIRNGVRYVRGNQNRNQKQAEIGAGSRESESEYTIQRSDTEEQTKGNRSEMLDGAKQDFAV